VTSPPSPPRVLIVDDDPDLLATLAQSVRILGNFEVVVANHGIAGLEVFLTTPVDCVVVDIRMPGLNGYQLVRTLRGDPATSHAPIVILSALVQDEDELNGLLSGADAYLRKPVDLATLMATITQAIQINTAQRDQRARDLADGYFS
jgi:two-component system, cell cycle response regulator